MKYKTVIETDNYKGFEFFEDGNGKYMVAKDAGVSAYGGWIPLHFTECEQESVLDKIREIVDEWETHYSGTENLAYEYMVQIAELVGSQESEVEKDV